MGKNSQHINNFLQRRQTPPAAPAIPDTVVATMPNGVAIATSASTPLSKEQMEKLAAEFKSQFSAGKGYTLLPNGSIEILVTIDEDMSGGLLASADQAGMPTADYIRQIIADSLTAYWAGAGA